MALHETPQERYLALKMDKVMLKGGRSVSIKYEKINFESISTDEVPCTEDQDYNVEFCTLMMKEKLFVDTFKCRFPFMEQLLENKTQVCTEDLKEKEKFWNSENLTQPDICPFVQRCHRSTLKTNDKYESTDTDDISSNFITISTPIVQVIKDQYSYDMQSFIGEVGGTLGLMLGYSFMSLIDFIEHVLALLKQKMYQ